MRQHDSGLVAHRPPSKPDRYGSSLQKAVKLLDAFEPGRELTASQLAAAISVDRSTGFRLAQALTRYGWLCQDPESRRYRPGIRLWELGSLAISDVDVRRAAHPHMQTLAVKTGECCDLVIRDGRYVIYIERVEGHHLRAFSRVGMRVPAHALAMGRVLLAYIPLQERHQLLGDRLQRYTRKTVTRTVDLDRLCDEVLVDHYAVNFGEWRADAGGIAAPVFDRLGRCVAALSICLPASVLTPGSILELAPLVKEAAAETSRDAGADLHEVGYSEFRRNPITDFD